MCRYLSSPPGVLITRTLLETVLYGCRRRCNMTECQYSCYLSCVSPLTATRDGAYVCESVGRHLDGVATLVRYVEWVVSSLALAVDECAFKSSAVCGNRGLGNPYVGGQAPESCRTAEQSSLESHAFPYRTLLCVYTSLPPPAPFRVHHLATPS